MEVLGSLSHEQQKLVADYYLFSKKLSSKFIKRAYSYGCSGEEIESAATYGLCLSALRFRSDGGTKFSTYAFLRINGEIRDLLRNKKKQNKVEHKESSDDSVQSFEMIKPKTGEVSNYLGYSIPQSSTLQKCDCIYIANSNPENSSARVSTNKILRDIMRILPSNAQFMIEQYYFKNRTMDEIKKELCLSSRIATFRLHHKALKILKQELERRQLNFDDFLNLAN